MVGSLKLRVRKVSFGLLLMFCCEKSCTTTVVMFTLSLWMLLTPAFITSSSDLQMITTADKDIFVDDSLAVDKGNRSPDLLNGIYKKLLNPSSAEAIHFDGIKTQVFPLQIAGRWKRESAKSRYLLGLNSKPTDTSPITRMLTE